FLINNSLLNLFQLPQLHFCNYLTFSSLISPFFNPLPESGCKDKEKGIFYTSIILKSSKES
ncbi:MAG: hypothetical protein AAF363_22540, partial [Bacteroidota bacterium]